MPTYPDAERPPGEDADELTWLLYRQDRVISRRQARRFLTDAAIRAKLDAGRWRAVARAVYVTHNGPLTRRQRRWVAVLGAGTTRPAILAGASALECHGLKGYSSQALHLLIPARSRDRDAPRV